MAEINSQYDDSSRIEAEREAQKRAEEEARQNSENEGRTIFDEDSALKRNPNQIANYDEWIASLQARGLSTTHINDGEANFADYGNALSTELQQRILGSFDRDEDYVLQQTLASLFTDGNFEGQGDIYAKCAALGIQVSCEYVPTTYIIDNKKNHVWNKDNATQGSICLYTFTDANGGEIIIADSNGNGGLEVEELFENEILSGIASDLKADASKNVAGGGHGVSGANRLSGMSDIERKLFVKSNNYSEFLKELQEIKAKALSNNGKKEISSSEFERLVEQQTEYYLENYDITYQNAYNKAFDKISEDFVIADNIVA